MNRRQLYILLIGVFVFTLSELFPAWLYEDENTSVRRSAGYHFLLTPPQVKSPTEMRKIFNLKETDSTRFMWVHRDGIRVLGQRLSILFLTVGAVLISLNRRILVVYIFGWLCLCLGVGMVALLIFHVFFLLS